MSNPLTNSLYTYQNFPLVDGTDLLWSETPLSNPAPDGVFWATEFYFGPAGGTATTTGYFGIQTEGANPSGEIAIFSIWGAVGAESPGVVVDGVEGTPFWSVRIPFDWIVGDTYNFEVVKGATQGADTWWDAYISLAGSKVKTFIGEILVPTSDGNLQPDTVSFTETYSLPANVTTAAQVAYSAVEFSNWTLNGAKPIEQSNVVEPMQAHASITDVHGGVEQIIGTAPGPAVDIVGHASDFFHS